MTEAGEVGAMEVGEAGVTEAGAKEAGEGGGGEGCGGVDGGGGDGVLGPSPRWGCGGTPRAKAGGVDFFIYRDHRLYHCFIVFGVLLFFIPGCHFCRRRLCSYVSCFLLFISIPTCFSPQTLMLMSDCLCLLTNAHR